MSANGSGNASNPDDDKRIHCFYAEIGGKFAGRCPRFGLTVDGFSDRGICEEVLAHAARRVGALTVEHCFTHHATGEQPPAVAQ